MALMMMMNLCVFVLQLLYVPFNCVLMYCGFKCVVECLWQIYLN